MELGYRNFDAMRKERGAKWHRTMSETDERANVIGAGSEAANDLSAGIDW